MRKRVREEKRIAGERSVGTANKFVFVGASMDGWAPTKNTRPKLHVVQKSWRLSEKKEKKKTINKGVFKNSTKKSAL